MNEVLENLAFTTNIICTVAIIVCYIKIIKNEKRRSKLLDELKKEREEQEATYKKWKEIVQNDMIARGQGTD